VLENTARVEGGGVFIYSSNLGPVISQFSVRGNTARGGDGGGLYMRVFLGAGSQPARIENGDISDNTAAIGNGGGVYFSGFSGVQRAELTNVVVKGNLADGAGAGRGGGIYMLDTSPVATNVTIESNTAYVDGGGMWLVVNQGQAQRSIFQRSKIRSNVARSGSGGGVYLTSQAAVNVPGILDTVFESNSAAYGGGLWLQYVIPSLRVDISSSSFIGNRANYTGGGLWTSASKMRLVGVSFASNTAGSSGAGYSASLFSSSSSGDLIILSSSFQSNAALNGGGGLLSVGLALTVTNTSFSTNDGGSAEGGAISAKLSSSSTFSLTDCQLRSNVAAVGGAVSASADEDVACVDIENAPAGTVPACVSSCPIVTLSGSVFDSNRAASSGTERNGGGSAHFVRVSAIVSGASSFNNNTAVGLREVYGGSLYSQFGCLQLTSATFTANSVLGSRFDAFGGAIAAVQSSVVGTGATFTSNSVGANVEANQIRALGGAILLQTSRGRLSGCDFVSNVAGGPGASGFGGAAALDSQSFCIVENGARFTKNRASGPSEAVGAGGALAVILQSGASILSGADFENNTAGTGGAVFMQSTDQVSATDTIIRYNAAYQGGALGLVAATASLTRATIRFNTASYRAGAIYMNAESKLNTTLGSISDNSAQYLGGVYDLSNRWTQSGTIVSDNVPEYYGTNFLILSVKI
jgi:hypothetical protein